jgi:hypothetical protein
MPSVAFDQFLPEILPDVPGVPHPMAINAIRNACYDFCWKSLLWNVAMDAEPYLAGTAEYSLAPPSNAQVVAVLSLALDDTTVLYPVPYDDLSRANPDWQVRTGSPSMYTQPDTATIRLFPTPETDGTFRVVAAFAPTRRATATEAFLFDQHLDTIRYGTLAKLKSSFNQPWSDPAGAAHMEQRFMHGVLAATVQRNKGNARADLRVASRPFV